MGPSRSPEAFDAGEQRALLVIAMRSVLAGLDGRRLVMPDTRELPETLRRPHGAFVTLRVGGRLNGCIGSMGVRDPLAEVVARMAWEAAFADPRLPALQIQDLPELHVEISVLSPMEPVAAATRGQLLANITPGTHGILIEAGFAHATLLPAVWAECPDPERFLDLLMHKAGIDPRHWPIGMRAFRYTATEFGADASDIGADEP